MRVGAASLLATRSSSFSSSQTSQSPDRLPSQAGRSQRGSPDQDLSAAEQVAQQRQLQQLKNRDREVRAHELAHASVGGRYVTSGINLQYQRGPDGRLYAVAGEVSIDTSEVPGDPQATLEKAQVVLRAALAPVDPSAQDRRVAAQAVALIQQARAELALQDDPQTTGSRLDVFA